MGTEVISIVIAACVAVIGLTLIVKGVLWVGKDARRRGLRHVGWLQLLAAVQFPWPLLMYYLVTRSLDANEAEDLNEQTA